MKPTKPESGSKQARAPEAIKPQAPEPTLSSPEKPEAPPETSESKGDESPEASQPPKPPPVAQKGSRAYEITGPGSICQGGRFHGPGSVIVLSKADAKAFADRIKPAS